MVYCSSQGVGKDTNFIIFFPFSLWGGVAVVASRKNAAETMRDADNVDYLVLLTYTQT